MKYIAYVLAFADAWQMEMLIIVLRGIFMNKEEHVIELDLIKIAKALWNKVVYILIITLIFGCAGFAGSKTLKTPIYQATAKLIVCTQSIGSEDVSNDRVNSAKALVETYAVVIRDRDVINQVIDELGLNESYGQLADCISVKAISDTQIMQIIVRHPNQGIAFSVAQKLQMIAPDIIKAAVGIGSLSPVGQPYSSSYPVSPNNMKDAILMALVGLALSCGFVMLLFFLDNTYKSDADIQDDLDVLVLGVIPKVECCSTRYGYSYGYGYGYGYGHPHKSKKQVKEGN